MGKYLLTNGQTVTDEELDAEAQKWESGAWEGHLTSYRPGPGRPRLSNMDNANISFKCPQAEADEISQAAKKMGMGKSAYIRQALREANAKVLADAS